MHDWRDRLVQAETPGGLTADLVLDPLGRLVAKRTTAPAGTLHRAYLHDGDQVVEEYASAPGQAGVLLARRHHWGRWIDDLVAEQADTDGDGTLETTLYPVTDLLGSVRPAVLTGVRRERPEMPMMVGARRVEEPSRTRRYVAGSEIRVRPPARHDPAA